MVAYSFQKMFAPPILSGAKRQTIRGFRKRHARVLAEGHAVVASIARMARQIVEDAG